MKALILAAGIGRRMRPLTDHQHKTLLTISNSTIIDRIIDSLVQQEITDITIVTGYRAGELRAHVTGRFPTLDVRYIHNDQYDTTNNIFSMALAFEAMDFDSDLVLIESDLIYEPAVLKRLLCSRWTNVALVDRFQAGMDGTVVTLSSDQVVTQVIPPSLQPDNFDFTDKFKTLNIYKFGKEFCATTLRKLVTYYARTIDDNCYYELILGILIYMQQAEIHAEVIDGEQWAEVDDPTDLRLAELTFNTESRYELLADGWGGTWGADIVDFAFIRNMYFPTPAMFSELRLYLPELLQTYGSRQSTLNEKLAWALQRDAGFVYALAGASQCYPWLRSWFEGKRVLIPHPTFGEYSRVFPEAVRYEDRPGMAWSELEETAAAADVVVFVNPNNPTGTVLESRRILEFADANPMKTLIVDESFIDFADEPSIVSSLESGAAPNVIVIKSLSKSLGVPGLRLGAIFTADPRLARRIEAELPIWNLNSVAENFLELMLKHRQELEQSFSQTVVDREELSGMLRACHMVEEVYPSGGDFLLVRLAMDASESHEFAKRLVERRSIFIKDASEKMSDGRGYWRLAVRTTPDHQLLCESMNALAPILDQVR